MVESSVKSQMRPPPKQRRVTQSIKENIVLTFEMLGGVEKYAEWAKSNPDKFYSHWVSLLPSEIKAEVNVSHDFVTVLEKARARLIDPDPPPVIQIPEKEALKGLTFDGTCREATRAAIKTALKGVTPHEPLIGETL